MIELLPDPVRPLPSLMEVLYPTWTPSESANARLIELQAKEPVDSLGRPNTGRPRGAKYKGKRKGKA